MLSMSRHAVFAAGITTLCLATSVLADAISMTTPNGARTMAVGTIAGNDGVASQLDPGRYYKVELISSKNVVPPIDHLEGAAYALGATSFNWSLLWNTGNETAGSYTIIADLLHTEDMGQTYSIDATAAQGDQTLTQ